MEIQELLLKHYGKFDNHRISLKPGINIIYGGNERGKSTIHSFIRAMFFGLGRGKGRAARTDEYQIRQPWDTPGAFLGSMRVSEQGNVYRIERCFDKSTQPLRVICETTGEEMADPEETMEWLLGGMSESAFQNTVYIAQSGSITDEALAQELRRYMVNSESTLDAQLDVSQALQRLRKKKKLFEQKKKKEDARMEQEIEKKQLQAEKIRGELEGLRQQGAMERPAGGPEEEEEDGFFSTGRRICEILLFLAGALALAGAYFLGDWKLKVFLGIFGAVFLLMIIPVHFLLSDSESQEASEPPEKEDGGPLADMVRSRQADYQKLQDELEELYHRHVRLDGTDTEIAALDLAIDRICALSSGIYARSGGRLNTRASEILSELTGGAYDSIRLNESFQVQINTRDRVLGLHQVSGGTIQQIYFALRMAAGELLCEGRQMPVILDEAFAMYDDARLEMTLRWLKKSGRQVILFTCHRREREILERI